MRQRWGDRVRVLQGSQPVPEWAAEPATADVAYLVDAGPHTKPRLTAVGKGSPRLNSHTLDAAGVLQLTRILFGRAPRAYVLSVPATDLGYGETLSPQVEASVQGALRLLSRRLAAHFACTKSA